MERIVTLDVGGKIFRTSTKTLEQFPNSMLARMFAETNESMVKPQADGSYFIDRSPHLFKHILQQYRRADIRVPFDVDPHDWKIECGFWGLISNIPHEKLSIAAIQEQKRERICKIIYEEMRVVLETGSCNCIWLQVPCRKDEDNQDQWTTDDYITVLPVAPHKMNKHDSQLYESFSWRDVLYPHVMFSKKVEFDDYFRIVLFHDIWTRLGVLIERPIISMEKNRPCTYLKANYDTKLKDVTDYPTRNWMTRRPPPVADLRHIIPLFILRVTFKE
jgi:BTB/POZ domain-containing protein